jgi:expansin (peptidoglycan-binding protein)
MAIGTAVTLASGGPPREGHLGLGREAFARIGSKAGGIIPITSRPVRDPGLPGPLPVRARESSVRMY